MKWSAVAVVCLALMWGSSVNPSVALAQKDRGFQSLFDGKSLKGWDGNPKFWSVRDGVITGQTTPDNPTKGNTFLIWRGGEVGDFELQAEFRIVGGNSGIQFRSRERSKWVMAGYQADFDAGNAWTGTLYDEKTGRGVLAKRSQKVVIGADGKKETVGETTAADKIVSAVKSEKWNHYRIVARGNHFQQFVNGLLTIDVVDHQAPPERRRGLLALQLHQGPPMLVQFRNVHLKHLTATSAAAAKKKVVFMAGTKSHGYGSHEHNAGCLLLANSLRIAMPQLDVVVYQNGWPDDPGAFDDADTIVMYCDGGGRHPVNENLEQVDRLAKEGVGVVCIHYGVEVPKGEPGDHLLSWIGGYFETFWSVNPHWTAEFKQLPDHPITKGVKPFSINDEWYYHMRFREGMKGVTPILTAIPPASTLNRRDGAHSGNPHVRSKIGQPQHVAWASENPAGGRGFGFTGGHFHWNWGDANFRKLVLNAILWTAKVDVPNGGVADKPVTLQQLEQNQDYPKPDNFDREKVRQRLGLPAGEADADVASKKKAVTADPRDPAAAVAGLQVADGLEATLFTSEPAVRSLTNLDIDHRGRIWVCEVVNYRRHAGERPEGDRILILEDVDGDGRADKTKTFYQGNDVDSAMGICVLGNRVIVSCSPNVIVFTDENGDDKPDKKEILFSNTGQPQHDHSAHSFIFGPDGKLYWNFGNTGKSVHDKDGRTVVDQAGNPVVDNGKPYYGGMPFRCNLDGSEFEVLAHNFRNNYEVTVDSFGTIWQSDNDDDGNRGVRINYVMEHGNYGYKDELTGAGWRESRTNLESDIPLRHWHLNDPGVVPNLLQTGAGSPTGILVYEGRLLPRRFWNQVIHCDAGPNVVRAYPVKNSGAGYSATVANIVKGDPDNWFRPADVCVAPDGSLFITDWYDPGVGGHRQGDSGRGRIFRVAPPKSKYRTPQLDVSSVAGALRALRSPNLATRYLGWTALHKQGKAAEQALARQFKNARNQRLRARALWLLGKIDGRGQHYVDVALADKNPQIRIVGIRLARQLKLDLIPVLTRAAADSNAQVRREAALALRNSRAPGAASLWADLASRHDGQDRWYLEALGIAADGQWDRFLDAWLTKAGGNWNSTAGRDIVWRSRASKTPAMLATLIRDPATPTGDLPRYFRALDYQDRAARDAHVEKLAFVDSAALEGARRQLVASEAVQRVTTERVLGNSDYRAALNRLLDESQGTLHFVKLVERFRASDRHPQLLDVAEANSTNELGIAAIKVLLGGDGRRLLRRALGGQDHESAVRVAEVLGVSLDGRAVPLLLDVVKDKRADSELRRQATQAVARSNKGAMDLVALVDRGELDAALKPAAAAALNGSSSRNVREQANRLFPLPADRGQKKLPPISELVKRKGAIDRGKLVFDKQGKCATCHLVNGQGKQVGPDLSEIGAKLSRQALLESIIFPSAGISHNYENYNLLLNDGNVLAGIIVSQTESAVTLRGADAITRTIQKADIDEMSKLPISLMPADLQQTVTTQELIDVVEYLQTLKKARK